MLDYYNLLCASNVRPVIFVRNLLHQLFKVVLKFYLMKQIPYSKLIIHLTVVGVLLEGRVDIKEGWL